MNRKKRIIAGILIVLLIAGVWNREQIYLNISMYRFFKALENENIDDFTLTVYGPLDVFTLYPLKVDDLIRICKDTKIVIKGNDLKEHIDSFKQLSNVNLKPAKKKSAFMNIRFYYVFESKKYGELFGFAMASSNFNAYVNGIEVVNAYDVFWFPVMSFKRELERK